MGHLVISTRVSPSGSSAPSARIDPSCITLNPNATSSASLTVTTTAFTQPGDYNVIVVVGFTVSPSGWSTSRASTVLVTVTRNGYAGPVIASLGIVGAVVSVIIVRKSGVAPLLTTRGKTLTSQKASARLFGAHPRSKELMKPSVIISLHS